MKAQTVRVLDVLVIGPAMVAGGAVVYGDAVAGPRRALGAFLVLAGVATVVYNGSNWLKQDGSPKAAPRSYPRPGVAHQASDSLNKRNENVE